MTQIYHSASPEETEEIARTLANQAKKGDFFAMYGDLASGKTVFARGFVSAWIPAARVTSPTYAILNVYRGEGITINHFDLYRITSEDDLASTGYYEAIEEGITLCEWTEKIPYALPESYYAVRFEKTGDEERTITVERIEA